MMNVRAHLTALISLIALFRNLHFKLLTLMSRIQIITAPRYPFATEIQIYISHVDQGGHLDNAQLLTLAS